MNSDRAIVKRVAQKEVGIFFSSPVAWLYLAFFATSTLFIFFWVETFFARNIADMRPLFKWMPLLLIFLGSTISMRMWSEERRTGALEHMLTLPVSPWLFVLGKFRACFSLLLMALVATTPLPITVALIADLDWGPVAASYLGAALLGGMYLSIGLYISAKTDNSITSLIGSIALGVAIYLLGSDLITSLFDSDMAETLRHLGSGSRYERISRGIVTFADLFYFFSISCGFLTLNVYALEQQRWAKGISNARHRKWRTVTFLVLLNLTLANLWLDRIDNLRIDVTEGRVHTLSESSTELLAKLQEPLLIRAYFSARTHPLLAPLAPRLRDMIKEYAAMGRGMVNIEIIDPSEDATLEQQANEQFGINSTPFQVSDRYQTALVNAYFDLVIQYGDQHTVLDFSDLIEVHANNNSEPEVRLRNPEFDISKAIKQVVQQYRKGDSLFLTLDEPIEFIGYVSSDDLLPPALIAYRESIEAELQELVQHSGGKFSYRLLEPEARGGELAKTISKDWGFTPMQAEQSPEQAFFFYLTLADTNLVVQLPTAGFDPDGFRTALHAGIRRYSADLTKTVALAGAPVNAEMARYHLGGPTFNNLDRALAKDYDILREDLDDGEVGAQADILLVLAPRQLSEAAIFAIDQFLMRGGTVILATSPYSVEIAGGEMRLQPWNSGLDDWLLHHGLRVGKGLVLDPQNARFPTPVVRHSAGKKFDDVQMINYPYLIDIREKGLNQSHPATRNLPQLTMAWAAPIAVENGTGRQTTNLLSSSEQSWVSTSSRLLPPDTSEPQQNAKPAAHTLAVSMQGRFDSWFADQRPPPSKVSTTSVAKSERPATALLQRSAESARLIVFASNDFMDDQILGMMVQASGTQYLGPVQLLSNTIDWALHEDKLLQISSRAHFNRSLPPMTKRHQQNLEYMNYAMVLLWLLALASVHWVRKRLKRRRYERGLAL